VGKTPGATASVNMYALVDRHQKPLLGFVDLPGFGYAKLSKEQKASVEVAAERYLGKRNAKELALGILLVDIRRIPSDDDRAVLAALFDMGVPLVVVATKVDKVTGKERETNLKNIQLGLGLPDGQPLCISSVTGENTKQLWSIILDSCERKIDELQGIEEEFEEDDDEIYDDDEEVWVDDEDLQYDQGYDWIQSGGGTIMYEKEVEADSTQQKSAPVFARSGEYRSDDTDTDQENGDMNDDDDDEYYSESKQRMIENTERQIAENERFKLKNLKKTVREMERRGEI
jgi:GTP-binding protein